MEELKLFSMHHVPLLVKKGNFVTCYNRSHEKSEEEYKEIQGRKEYKGVSLKKYDSNRIIVSSDGFFSCY